MGFHAGLFVDDAFLRVGDQGRGQKVVDVGRLGNDRKLEAFDGVLFASHQSLPLMKGPYLEPLVAKVTALGDLAFKN